MESYHYIGGLKYTIRDKKVYNSDGLVGIVYSPGGGTGLTTWSKGIDPTDYRIVLCVLFGFKRSQVKESIKELCAGGWKNVRIFWYNPRKNFNIEKDGGNEKIILHELFKKIEI